jgi:hypothetical protein
MDTSVPPDAIRNEPSAAIGPPPIQRCIAIFTHPADAWAGLRERAQWWFPVVVLMIVTLGGSALLYHRAQLPTMFETMEEQVANGQMSADQLEKIEAFYAGPVGLSLTVGIGAVWFLASTVVAALLVWFGVGFVLGTDFKYRHALEVTAWSALVTIPAFALTAILAWIKQGFRDVHVGFGILLNPETPSKLTTGVQAFLDLLGPLALWHLVVGILGAAALSGAPRKSVAWVLGGLYLAVSLLMAALAGLFTPGA